ncbi:MAG: hypothetical protein APU95_00515 [Hadesarchaea archaeon YNP_N21]|nr:MAG: hypothetical protein APU95_00515 [Hadesarchaea archaeon YNP_N21]
MPEAKNSLFRKIFLLSFAVLIALDYAVPYTLLSGTQKISGSFLFWPTLTIAAACLAFIALYKWR